MRLQQWCMLGVTVLLLLCQMAVSQLCKSLITMVDGFHTLFILMQMALPQTEDIIKPHISSLDSSPSSPTESFSLGRFPTPLHSEPPAELPDQSEAKQPNHDPASVVGSHTDLSSVTPSCSLSFPKSRIHPVGVFISSLLLVSLCVSYFLEIIGFIVKPHPVQHPLLPVVVGSGSLLHKMLLFVLDWNEMLDKKPESCRHAETEPPLEINHKACAEEESQSQEEEQLSVRSKGQIAAHNCLHSGALVLCNPGSPSLPEHGCETELQLLEIGKESSGAHLKRGSPRHHPSIQHPVSDFRNTPGPSSVSTSWPGWGCRWSLCFLSFVFVIQGLFTSLLALINSLVTVLVVPQLQHSSEACHVLVYLDPGLSLLAVIMLIATSLPRVYRYGMLLTQASPPHIRVSDVGRRIAGVPGVQAVHDLHIWQLTESLTVASVHVHCHAGFQLSRCADLMSGVTKVLQSVGVSCSTVQPEFISSSSSFRGEDRREDPSCLPLAPCSLACAKACASKMCCSLLEEKEGETRSTQKPPGEETNEEPPTLIIENTFL